jgi:hypothetical protein
VGVSLETVAGDSEVFKTEHLPGGGNLPPDTINGADGKTMDAEVRMGELLKGLPKAQGARNDLTYSHQWEEVAEGTAEGD